MRFANGELNSTVNAMPAHRNTAAMVSVHYSPDEFPVGLGAWDDANRAVLRYRNVQVRLLPATKAPARLFGAGKVIDPPDACP